MQPISTVASRGSIKRVTPRFPKCINVAEDYVTSKIAIWPSNNNKEFLQMFLRHRRGVLGSDPQPFADVGVEAPDGGSEAADGRVEAANGGIGVADGGVGGADGCVEAADGGLGLPKW